MMTRTTSIPLPERSLTTGETGCLETLVADMLKMGIIVTREHADGLARLDFTYDVERHKRNAGRKPIPVPERSAVSSLGEAELDKWIASHDLAEVMDALGVSRSTAYRRISQAKHRLDSD